MKKKSFLICIAFLALFIFKEVKSFSTLTKIQYNSEQRDVCFQKIPDFTITGPDFITESVDDLCKVKFQNNFYYLTDLNSFELKSIDNSIKLNTNSQACCTLLFNSIPAYMAYCNYRL